MNWDTIQQVLRILLYTIGGWLFGDAVAQGAEFQQAVGGVLAFGAFIWWFFWERKRPDGVNSSVGGILFIGAIVLGFSGMMAGHGYSLLWLAFLVAVLWISAIHMAHTRRST